MDTYDDACLETFLKKQRQLFREDVATNLDEAEAFLEDCMAIVCKNLDEVRDYLEGYEVEEAAMAEMVSRANNRQSGCFRLLDRTLNNVLRILKQKGGTRITMKVVGEASSMMML